MARPLEWSAKFLVCLRKLARPRGVEPLTPRSVVWCSIQLSYGRMPAAALAAKGGNNYSSPAAEASAIGGGEGLAVAGGI